MMKILHTIEEEFNPINNIIFHGKQNKVSTVRLLATLVNESLFGDKDYYQIVNKHRKLFESVDNIGGHMPSDELEILYDEYDAILQQDNSLSIYLNEELSEQELANLDVERLLYILFKVPNDLIEFIVNYLVVHPSNSGLSLYDGDFKNNKYRISEHWNTGNWNRLDKDSLIPEQKSFAIGELVGKNRYNIINVSGSKVSRTKKEKQEIASMIKNKVFNSCLKQQQNIDEFITKFL